MTTVTFQCGFETGDYSEWDCEAGDTTFEQIIVKEGNYSLQTGSRDIFYDDFVSKAITFSSTFNIKGWVRIDEWTTTTEEDAGLLLGAYSSDVACNTSPYAESYGFALGIERIGGVNKLVLYDGAAIAFTDLNITLVTGVWYYVVIRIVMHATAGTVEIWINGTSKAALTSKKTDTLTRIIIGYGNAMPTPGTGHGDQTCYFDSARVDDGPTGGWGFPTTVGLLALPKVSVTLGGTAIASANIINLNLHLGATREVSDFVLTLDNTNNTYGADGGANEIEEGDAAVIGVGRTPNAPTLLTGKVETIEFQERTEEGVKSDIAVISGRCNGWELFNRKFHGDLVALAGSGAAHTMVKYLIDNYTSLSHSRSGTELVEDSDTTFITLERDYTSVWDVITFISENSDKNGVIGFEMRIAYDGLFEWFPKATKVSDYNLKQNVQLENYVKDILCVRNKIWVFGRKDKPYPLDADGQIYSDGWSEQATATLHNKSELSLDAASAQAVIRIPAGDGAQFAADDWLFITDDDSSVDWGELRQISSISAGTGPSGEDEITFTANLGRAFTIANNAIVWEVWATNGGWGFHPDNANNDITITGDTTIKTEGSRSVKFVGANAITDYFAQLVLLAAEQFSMEDYPDIKFKIYFTTTLPTDLRITLYSNDFGVNDSAVIFVTVPRPVGQWHEVTVTGGIENAGEWTVGSAFEWDKIGMIEIRPIYASGTYTFCIDRLHAFGKRWGGGSSDSATDGFAEDSTSQTAYGTREHVVVNDAFLSDQECEARAQALIDLFKDPIEKSTASTTTLDWGLFYPMAGNWVLTEMINYPNYKFYRIDSIDIFVGQDQVLRVEFELGSVVMRMADYLYTQRKAVTELQRRGSRFG